MSNLVGTYFHWIYIFTLVCCIAFRFPPFVHCSCAQRTHKPEIRLHLAVHIVLCDKYSHFIVICLIFFFNFTFFVWIIHYFDVGFVASPPIGMYWLITNTFCPSPPPLPSRLPRPLNTEINIILHFSGDCIFPLTHVLEKVYWRTKYTTAYHTNMFVFINVFTHSFRCIDVDAGGRLRSTWHSKHTHLGKLYVYLHVIGRTTQHCGDADDDVIQSNAHTTSIIWPARRFVPCIHARCLCVCVRACARCMQCTHLCRQSLLK